MKYTLSNEICCEKVGHQLDIFPIPNHAWVERVKMSATWTFFFKLCWVFKWSWLRAELCPWTSQMDILTIWDLITYETGGRKRYGSLSIMQNNSTVRPTPSATPRAGLHVQDNDLLKGPQGARHTLTYAIWAHGQKWTGRTQRWR